MTEIGVSNEKQEKSQQFLGGIENFKTNTVNNMTFTQQVEIMN